MALQSTLLTPPHTRTCFNAVSSTRAARRSVISISSRSIHRARKARTCVACKLISDVKRVGEDTLLYTAPFHRPTHGTAQALSKSFPPRSRGEARAKGKACLGRGGDPEQRFHHPAHLAVVAELDDVGVHLAESVGDKQGAVLRVGKVILGQQRADLCQTKDGGGGERRKGVGCYQPATNEKNLKRIIWFFRSWEFFTSNASPPLSRRLSTFALWLSQDNKPVS